VKNALGAVSTVLLLGGRSQIGQAIVTALIDGGARQVLLAARGGVDEATLAGLRRDGVQVDGCAFDGTDPGSHPAFVAEAFDRLGDIDVVIDAFGVLGSNEAFEADPVAAADAVAANFGGHVSVDLLVAERLRRQGHGTLVVLSSVAGVRVRKANYVYGATKAGLDGFATGLGDRLAGTGASVMVVRPGFVHTSMSAGVAAAPLACTAEDVAGAVVTALRTGRETVWVPAALAPLFTVLRNAPRAVWRRLPR
jgi:decaprenylphospho-beta-D-erythro-pentofuranosid-2-ulose 2-reductase